jgi:hypothetical protein
MADSQEGDAQAREPGSPEPERSTAASPARPAGLLKQVSNWLQRLASFGLMRATSLRSPAGAGEPIRARARLESLRIEECYSYQQDISLNSAITLGAEPKGSITMKLPFDGDKCFSRQAREDVIHSRRAHSDPHALIGFLALSGHQKTDLGELMDWDPPGSIPITIELPPQPVPQDPDPLVADASTCVISQVFRPRLAVGQLAPLHIDVTLDDPDTVEFSRDLFTGEASVARDRIMRHVEFKPGLSVRMHVRLHIPRTLADGAEAEVSEVFIVWPTRTSLSSLALHVDGQHHDFRYNPEWKNSAEPEGDRECGLEWHNIPMELEGEPLGGEIRTFCSPEMVLSIPKPGEIYWQENLCGRVKVTVNKLLSGMESRLFDATGKKYLRAPMKTTSVVSASFSLTLDDAFARRTRSPYQQLYFGEVIPSRMRIDDIVTALRNRGFDVHLPVEIDPASCLLSAERINGPKKLQLMLFVRGQHFRTQRQRTVPGGLSYRSSVESGELLIYVYGFLQRDSHAVIQEVNALRRALYERFNRLPAWR